EHVYALLQRLVEDRSQRHEQEQRHERERQADQQPAHERRLGVEQSPGTPRGALGIGGGAFGRGSDDQRIHARPCRRCARACSRLMASSSTKEMSSMTTAMAVAPL